MTNQKWDMKLDYMLTLAVCKYGLEPERWDLVAEDLAEYITTTSQVIYMTSPVTSSIFLFIYRLAKHNFNFYVNNILKIGK